ncbi:MAG: threonine dehydratase, partial [Gaiellales bacterium]|nr:threonine dehydratase [Gaiellales bacterium]
MISLDDIRAAAANLHGVAHRTPLLRSQTFSEWAGCEVHLKFENQQRTGSFKIRGAYTKLLSLSDAERAAGVIAPSAGNHAQAVAFAARLLDVSATVFMPGAASLAKVG